MRFGWSWNLGLDWACACAGVVWIPPSPPFFFLKITEMGLHLLFYELGFFFPFFRRCWRGLFLCVGGWELN